MSSPLRYEFPRDFIQYQFDTIASELVEAKSAVLALGSLPQQRSWVEELQRLELKREVAGTTRIEGAQFSEPELDAAIIAETPEQALNRSQREARAAAETYRWIARIPEDQPITPDLVLEIHRRIVTGANEGVEPGALRRAGHEVSYGSPRRGGAIGGDEVQRAFDALCQAIGTTFRGHDPLVQALAAHYHLAAMHPFGDGNGRTSRALEALLLRRAGLRDTCFIAMSNYYYEERTRYFDVLRLTHEAHHELSEFVRFGLRGVAAQSQRVLVQIRAHVARGVYRNLMFDLFDRLKSTRTRVIAKRQVRILTLLLDDGPLPLDVFHNRTREWYSGMKSARKALLRDLSGLFELGAIQANKDSAEQWALSVRLEWPTEVDGSIFMEKVRAMPRSKALPFQLGE